MKTRYMGYEDYGISMEEAYRAIKFCRDPKQRNTNLCIVMMSAFESNRYIWKELMTSACYNLSYQKMTKKKPINYEEVDFYAYRRKMIAILAKKLRTAKGA